MKSERGGLEAMCFFCFFCAAQTSLALLGPLAAPVPCRLTPDCYRDSALYCYSSRARTAPRHTVLADETQPCSLSSSLTVSVSLLLLLLLHYSNLYFFPSPAEVNHEVRSLASLNSQCSNFSVLQSHLLITVVFFSFFGN